MASILRRVGAGASPLVCPPAAATGSGAGADRAPGAPPGPATGNWHNRFDTILPRSTIQHCSTSRPQHFNTLTLQHEKVILI